MRIKQRGKNWGERRRKEKGVEISHECSFRVGFDTIVIFFVERKD